MKPGKLYDRMYRTFLNSKAFIDRALDIDYGDRSKLSGFEYGRDLLKAAMANTYVETVGNRGDSLHMAIKSVGVKDVYHAYLHAAKISAERLGLKEKDVVLAFDYTDEDFYGKTGGFFVHGWTGEKGVAGKFKFLTCSIVSGELPERIPLLSIPVKVLSSKARDVLFCLSLVKPLVKSIRLVLFDRGFYSKELMWALTNSEYPYLIFVPKHEDIKRELEQMERDERKKINKVFDFEKENKIIKGKTTLALLKKIMDPYSKKRFDWCFATDVDEIDLDDIIPTYKGRWNIETGFRVQDEARIKSKSTEIKIRFFYFVYEQFLQMTWSTFFKDELSFKQFIIDLYEVANWNVEKKLGAQ